MIYSRLQNGKIVFTSTLNRLEDDLRKFYVREQANTIEELCDEFVRVSRSVREFLISKDIPTKKYGNTEIYGANWTERGLIYVAKMNDKGEFVLY